MLMSAPQTCTKWGNCCSTGNFEDDKMKNNFHLCLKNRAHYWNRQIFWKKKKIIKKKHCEYPSLHQTKPSGFETIVKCHQQFAFQWEQRMSTPSQREKPIRSGTEWWDRSLGEGKENGGCILCIQAFTIITSVPLSKKSEVYWFPISWY